MTSFASKSACNSSPFPEGPLVLEVLLFPEEVISGFVPDGDIKSWADGGIVVEQSLNPLLLLQSASPAAQNRLGILVERQYHNILQVP